MRILITGASGFVGRHLVDYLVAAGHWVRATGRSRPRPSSLPPEVEWYGGIDLTRDRLADAVERMDAVVHLAGLAHRIDAEERADDAAFERVNVQATRRVAGAAAGAGVERVVFVSSIGAVCNDSLEPVSEATPPAPATAYGRSKLEAERVLARTLDRSAIELICLRPPLVYGPGNPGNMARLLRLTRTGLPLPLASVRNRRSLIYVGNLVDAIRAALEHPAPLAGTFHVADAEAVSTADLVRAIGRASGSEPVLVGFPSVGLRAAGRMGDMAQRLTGRSVGIDSYSIERLTSSLLVDASRFTQATGWTPRYTLAEGLRQTFSEPQSTRVPA